MKGHLTVGELSSIFGINIQTLHYYDRIGLLTPEKKQKNGYRLYRFDQIYSLAYIRFMRKMGYSIDEIANARNLRGSDDTIRNLREQSASVKKQLRELMRIDEALVRRASFIEERLKEADPGKICIKEFGERYYIPIGEEIQIYDSDAFYFYPTLAFYEEELKLFGSLLDGEMVEDETIMEEFPQASGDRAKVRTIPAGRYLVGWHKGEYETIGETFAMMRAAHPELEFGGQTTTLNIIDQFVEKDKERYITEIQMPIV